jgi:hypothetical protein
LLTAFGKLVLWALSVAGDNPRFLAEIDRMQSAIAEALTAPDGYEALAVLLRYISTTHERLDTDRFEKALTAAAGKDEAKIIMTILEELDAADAHGEEQVGVVLAQVGVDEAVLVELEAAPGDGSGDGAGKGRSTTRSSRRPGSYAPSTRRSSPAHLGRGGAPPWSSRAAAC